MFWTIALIITLTMIPLWAVITWLYGRWVRNWTPAPIDTLPFTWDELEAEIAAGNISDRRHPDDPTLHIYNYTAQAQYDRAWNPITEACRGLIIQNSKIKARPFTKFYNLSEKMFAWAGNDTPQLTPDGPFSAFEKEDGSLGIIYMAPDGIPAVATRGSFASDQAAWATTHLRDSERMIAFADRCIELGVTPLVEIIYPENRIVLDYGDFSGLIFLALIDNETGVDAANETLAEIPPWPGRLATLHLDLTIDQLRALPDENKEGFVLLFEDGTRIKLKFDKYVELHRILTGLTTRKIWEMVSQNISVERAKEWVPDEFYKWMKGVADDLRRQFTEIEKACLSVYSRIPPLTPGHEPSEFTIGSKKVTRKEQAEFILTQPNSGIVFKMLDGKEYKDQIWKMIYPAADTAKVNDEAS